MTIARHIRTRQIELARSIASRRKIYLDTRFWIIVRDTALGVRTEPAARELLHHLRRGVADGHHICPISTSVFLELMKQPYSPGRRIGTAQLIDELSLGVSMIAPPIVMGTEVRSFLLKAKGDVDLHPMQELIWTKAAYVLGGAYPSLVHISPDEELVIQKAFYNHLWDCSLGEVVKTIGDNTTLPDGFAELSRYTNEKNAQYKDELRSFAHTYEVELKGAIELAGDVAADVIHELAEKEAGCQLSPTPEERAVSVDMCRNLLLEAFRKPETKDVLRFLHVGASIHAGMRWNKARKFKPNDYYDFEHATAALSYCDAFLTEGSLHNLVTRPQINLEAVNGCRVFSDVQAAAEHVGQL
ncbi:hypothetical protein [Ralstonia pseudosolanacearum]|uniref:hypothetical protein n=1 Tax=Ralstonia pseudosolanacearum TaxID=1310165 RepID=UPI002677612D|nr:hypothetical protein [Ralstonia pseudosolanacearum]MDO3606540.1 hypothetical protein [Ralstonia pseudosolanacearum]MDO3610575.1 hypothetical protein [Ralstonia pseudosolanacearum]